MSDVEATGLRRWHGRGLSLIEALATLMLVAIVLPVVVRATGAAGQLGVLADRRAEAAALADRRLAEVLLEADWSGSGRQGTFDATTYGVGAERYRWELSFEPWEGRTRFRQIALRVFWEQRGREQQLSLGTVFYDGEGGG